MTMSVSYQQKLRKKNNFGNFLSLREASLAFAIRSYQADRKNTLSAFPHLTNIFSPRRLSVFGETKPSDSIRSPRDSLRAFNSFTIFIFARRFTDKIYHKTKLLHCEIVTQVNTM